MMYYVTYGFHDVLSWDADFQGMMSKLSVTCKECADLALFGGKTRLSVMMRRPELVLTVGILRGCQFSQARPRSASIYLPWLFLKLKLTISSFTSRTRRPYAIPRAIEVINLITSQHGVTCIQVCNLTAEEHFRAHWHLQAYRVEG
jgi:hypothetical protein